MKAIFLLSLIVFAAAEEEYYVLPKLLVSDISNNIGKLKTIMECFLERKPCSDILETYKARVPEAVQQACRKCTVDQKQFAAKFIEELETSLPRDYENFKNKYDPENKYFDELREELNKYKV